MKHFWISFKIDRGSHITKEKPFDFWIVDDPPFNQLSVWAIVDAYDEGSAWSKIEKYFDVREKTACYPMDDVVGTRRQA